MFTLFLREKVTTTNFTTLKTKKNIEKFGDHHYIESGDHLLEIHLLEKK
jgi:hypothetical protein